MKAVILAAGEGRRMRPLTLKTPKPLLKIKSKPIIEHIFDALPEEITEVVVVIRYLGEQIREFLGNEFKGKKAFFVEGSEKGTAFSFLAAKPYLAGESRFLFLYGDELVNSEDIKNCLKKDLGIIVFDSTTPHFHGMVSVGGDGFITDVIEKPKTSDSKIAIDGVMVLSGKIFEYEPEANEKGEYYFTSLLNKFVKYNKVWPVKSAGFIGDITTPEDIERIEKILSTKF